MMDKESIKQEIVNYVKNNEGCSIAEVKEYLASKNLIRGYSTTTIYVYELVNEGKLIVDGDVKKRLKIAEVVGDGDKKQIPK